MKKKIYHVTCSLLLFNGIKKKKFDGDKKVVDANKSDLKDLIIKTDISTSVALTILKDDYSKRKIRDKIKKKVAERYFMLNGKNVVKELTLSHRYFAALGLFKIKEESIKCPKVQVQSIDEFVQIPRVNVNEVRI